VRTVKYKVNETIQTLKDEIKSKDLIIEELKRTLEITIIKQRQIELEFRENREYDLRENQKLELGENELKAQRELEQALKLRERELREQRKKKGTGSPRKN